MEKHIPAEELTYTQWKEFFFSTEVENLAPNCCFATDDHLKYFLNEISLFTDKQIIYLIERFLLDGEKIGYEHDLVTWTLAEAKTKKELEDKHLTFPLLKRALNFNKSMYGGIHWVTDIMRQKPKDAINVLNTYLQVFAAFLPDWRLNGLLDSITIIEKKYYKRNVDYDIYYELSPREFEYLISLVYKEMGYDTEITKQTRDGGKDIIATKQNDSNTEEIYIECKLWKTEVNLDCVRNLYGAISADQVGKGIIIAPNGFTKDAKAFVKKNSRIELIGSDRFKVLMNSCFGHRWELGVNSILTMGYIRRDNIKDDQSLNK